MQEAKMQQSGSIEADDLARMARQHFLQNLCGSIPALDKLVLRRFESVPEDDAAKLQADKAFSPQEWRQAYARQRRDWAQGLLAIWREAFTQHSGQSGLQTLEDAAEPEDLELISDEAIENLIASSKLTLRIAERVDPQFAELRKRLRGLRQPELQERDPIRPSVIVENLFTAWQKAGMPQHSLTWAMDTIAGDWAALLSQAYQVANTFLDEHGAKPVAAARPAPPPAALAGGGGGIGGGGGSGAYPGSPPGLSPSDWAGAAAAGPGGMASQPPSHWIHAPQGGGPTGIAAAGYLAPHLYAPGAGVADIMQQPAAMLPPLHAPQAQFGQKALEQVQALWQDVRARLAQVVGVGAQPGGQQPTHLSTNLAQVLNVQQAQGIANLHGVVVQTAFVRSPAAAGAQIAELARQQSEAIRDKAGKPNEKAIIEMVALMFQSVLAEDRVPASVRVLFARLQVPVLRIALAEPEFFSDMNHPARRLIDRMGSAAMGFDGADFQGSVLETELRRLVQMIEQYPDTGSKVFQLALAEFEKFLRKFLTENRKAGKAMSVAQQVEEKETLLVKYTIELRKMLQDMPIKDEVRSFLFKVWAEVLAVSAVRVGPQDEETLRYKRAATLLVWATSAKTSARERSRVAQALPRLTRRLRKGLALVGVVDMAQEAALGRLLGLISEAFLAKTQTLAPGQLRAMSRRLENLENFISAEGVDDIPLNPENIELMLGMDASNLVVLQPADAEALKDVPTELLAWAGSRELGGWYTLAPAADAKGPNRARSSGDDGNGDDGIRLQYVWHSRHKHLHLFSSSAGRSYLIKLKTLAGYFHAGQLVPLDQEGLMLRATRQALTQYQALTQHQSLSPPPAATTAPAEPPTRTAQ
ncbi:DUF1631 family protein [Corticibacter populi]|uniref:DUF1631 family protein n=1 Tax=Corticibacter populi TaxID=1550736 RepID=A0A3M6QP33_9BURK|nr:DUF1631 family protein [Corticibacter populi]